MMNHQSRASTAVSGRDDPGVLSIDALDREIVAVSARMTSQEYTLLVLIREFDERGGWLRSGSKDCAHWLHWRLDLCPSTAREKVRVAHALKSLPQISAAFEHGVLSYSKVRALTRVATRASETDLLAFALTVSAALVEEHCRQLRNVLPDATTLARRAHRNRYLSASRNPSRGTMTLTMEVPIEDGELVLNTLDRVIGETPDAADASTSYRARQADALVALCQERSSAQGASEHDDGDQGKTRPPGSADSYQVVVHVDQSALAGSPQPGARSDLPAETVRRLTCDGKLVPLASDANGLPLSIGRKRRTVPTALKRALLARDRQCRFPGCTHTRFVDAHHVQHWAGGGETSLGNLMLLCGHHHRLVHEGGFTIFVDNHGNHCFRRPDGRAVPACGYRREDQMDDDGGCVSAETART